MVDLSVDKTLSIKCNNLYVEGALIVEIFSGNAKIDIQGNLFVRDEMDCYAIHVDGSIYCLHRTSALSIDVAQDLDVYSNVVAPNYNINVGGNFTCESVEARKICVLQNMNVSEIDATDVLAGQIITKRFRFKE